MNQKGESSKGKLPVKEGLFPWPLPEGGRTFFPKQSLCTDCQEKGDLKEISLGRDGKLYTYTIVRQGPPGFTPPYATALIDLPEGIRLFAQLTTADPDQIHLDGPVELTFGPIAVDKEGNEIISYLFRPVG